MQTNNTRDVYTLVTNQIIAQLERGTIPWRKPWKDAGMPKNLISHRPYRSINVWLLASLGYTTNLFLTYNQLTQIGGKVKRGEKGHVVVFWKVMDRAKEQVGDKTGEVKKNTTTLKYYWVFNIDQCEDIAEYLIDSPEELNTPIFPCENIVEGMPNTPPIQHKEPEAYYHPGKDYINMPKLKTFINSEAYYATLFHELVHSTGHTSRLDRKEVQSMTPFGSDMYSTEEIIAELGTCYLTSLTGIASLTFDNNAAYIQGWIERLRNNPNVIIYAATKAQKATDYILNAQPEEIESEVIEPEPELAESK